MGNFGEGLVGFLSQGGNAFLDEVARRHQEMLDDERFQLERQRVLQAIAESQQGMQQGATTFQQGQDEYRQMHTVDPRYQYTPTSDAGPMPSNAVSPYDYERLTGYSNPTQYNMGMETTGLQNSYNRERLDQMQNPRMAALNIPGYGQQEVPLEDKASVLNTLIQLEAVQREIDNGKYDDRPGPNPLGGISVIQDRVGNQVREYVMNIAKPILVSTGNYSIAANSSSNPEASRGLEDLIQKISMEVFADADTTGYIRMPTNVGDRVNALLGIASSSGGVGTQTPGDRAARAASIVKAIQAMRANSDSTRVE